MTVPIPQLPWKPGEVEPAGSTGSAGSVGSAAPVGSSGSTGQALVNRPEADGLALLGEVRAWLGRFVIVGDDDHLSLLTLWAAHTHLAMETYYTPRLILDSPLPGSGKTTVLEHLQRLCHEAVQMATLSSPAMVARLLDTGLKTILIDEADRSLSQDKEGIGDLIAVLNSGYKRGGARPVLVPSKGGDWTVKQMPTFAPVVMAGNNPNLPDDTVSRSIRVLLMPDTFGEAEESDWRRIEEDAEALGERLAAWGDQVREQVRTGSPVLPQEVKGRARERWAPLKQVADAAGGDWPDLVDRLAVQDVARVAQEKEEGIMAEKPHMVLLRHIAEVWPDGEAFVPTKVLIARLIESHPNDWGSWSSYGKDLTSQRMGRMLVKGFDIHSDRPSTGEDRDRGYKLSAFERAFKQFKLK